MAAHHPYAPWRRVILVPCWIIQLLLPAFTFVVMALAISVLMRDDFDGDDDDDDDFDDDDIKTSLSIGWLYLVFCALCIIITTTEVVMILRRKLHPLAFLIMNVLKSTFWTVLFVLDFVSASHQLRQRLAIVGIIVDVILILAFYIPLIHGSLVYHRYRSGSIYHAVDIKRFSDKSEAIEQFSPTFPQAYKSLTTTEVRDDVEQFPPSFPEAYIPLTTTEVVDDVDLEANTSNTPTETQRPRRLSYNHVRDTRFDSYKQTRRSFSDPNVVREMGSPTAELGKGTPTTERSRSSTLNIPTVVINDHDAEMEERRLHSNGRAELD